MVRKNTVRTDKNFTELNLIKMEKSTEKAMRFNENKPKWSLVDFDSLEDMVKVLEFGAKKYSADNWKNGLNTDEVVESLLRHIFKYLSGEDLDEESRLPHTGHILCNAMFLSYMNKYKKEFDTRRPDKNKICCGEWNEFGECKCKK